MDYYLLKNLKKSNRFKISSIMLNEGRLADEMRSIGIPTDIVQIKKAWLSANHKGSQEGPDSQLP